MTTQDKPIHLIPTHRPHIATQVDEAYLEAMALKAKIESARKTSILRDQRNAKLNTYFSFVAMLSIIALACLI